MRLDLLTTLALGAMILSACGDRAEDTDTDDGGGLGAVDTDTNTPDDTDDPGDTDDTDDPGPSACAAGPATTGPWSDGDIVHPLAAAGVSVTSAPYTHDAGLDDVIAATAGQTTATPVSIAVSGAIVTARGYVPANPTDNTVNLWLGDAAGGMYAYRIDVGMDPNLVQPGDAVSFTATMVQDFNGTLEITAVSDFTVDSKGNEVFVNDGMTGAPLEYGTVGLELVEVWGEITSAGADCGGPLCYDLQYGEHTAVFRSKSEFIYEGDCIHWIGPAGQFKGDVQLNHDDYDWTRIY